MVGGCGRGSTPSSPSTTAPATISIVGQNRTQAFSPNPSSFGGPMVVFRNNDSIPHRVVLNDGSIDTGNIRRRVRLGGHPAGVHGQYCDAY